MKSRGTSRIRLNHRCDLAQAIDVNVAGTRRVVQAAADAGCTKLVVASSIAAIGTAAPDHPPERVPIAADHRNVGAPWPYALSMSGREDLCRVACGLDAALDVIMMRIGNVVSFPDLIHKDGIGISYPQTAGDSLDVFTALSGGKKTVLFPEHKLASVALDDAVSCLEAAVRAPSLRPWPA